MSKHKPLDTIFPDARTVVPGRPVAYHATADQEESSHSNLGPPANIKGSRNVDGTKHQRRIRISVVLPVSLEVFVGTNEENPSEESDWRILSVVSSSCGVSPRGVEENMNEEEFARMSRLAMKAEKTL